MGGKGAADVARAVVKVVESGKSELKLLYPDDMPLLDKIRTIAREIYRANGHRRRQAGARPAQQFEAMGYGKLPVCMAKTQYSFSTDPDAQGRADRSHRARCARCGFRPAPSSSSRSAARS